MCRGCHPNTVNSEDLVAGPLPDGYWLEAFPFSTNATLPDLIGYGLGFSGKPSAIRLFQTPNGTSSSGWKMTEIQIMEFPVGMTYADLTGDGFNDIIICDRYGPGMNELWDSDTNNGGRVQWLRNPGTSDATPYWEAHEIGRSTGMHRLEGRLTLLSTGHFTSLGTTQILALPIIPASGDLTSPAPVIVYTPVYSGESPNIPASWEKSVPFASQFRLIHDVKLLKAGREGVVLLWVDRGTGQWKYNIVGTGLPKDGNNPYWGSGSVDIARVEDDEAGYIGFHGNTVAVYLKDNQTAAKGGESLKDSSLWRRVVIDNFGPLSVDHTGTIHHVATIKDSKKKSESFAIACMGAPVGKPENQGVYVYTPLNLANNEFRRTKVSDQSAGHLAVAGFTNPAAMDIASISYYVPGYHTGPDPPSIRINSLSSTISVTKLGKEVLLRVPRPKEILGCQVVQMPLVMIAGRKLTLVVVRPLATVPFECYGGVKIIYGTITLANGTSRGVAPPANTVSTTQSQGRIQAGEEGAVIILVEPAHNELQGPFSTMSMISEGTKNVFPQTSDVPADVRAMTFPFIKVEELPWPNSQDFKDFEFYNLTGFQVYFNDDAMEKVVHIQAWTLGLRETARFHRHDKDPFCEIHYCISNGGGNGGMRYFDPDTEFLDMEKELTKDYVESKSTLLPVPDMHEHGPLWKIQAGYANRPQLNSNGTAAYPWHAWLSSEFGQSPLPIVPPLGPDVQKYDVWLA
ncbi:hypothetical protein HYDPIDRAFT_169112 [Hydnomerulius pinastri MD-312]|uniref:Aldos-2-ulose dehydratase/isomerase (AUDH) Cupin domain-containing protein n=1 Tax=Hydnomerulius pinastri MD-312 TaxID=994086 RepID=A0A0C9WDF7_9AGAM|nr:hypothetical protein HYDPIDRAFT_169112 [Hydnomerulius pinastri MD-312]